MFKLRFWIRVGFFKNETFVDICRHISSRIKWVEVFWHWLNRGKRSSLSSSIGRDVDSSLGGLGGSTAGFSPWLGTDDSPDAGADSDSCAIWNNYTIIRDGFLIVWLLIFSWG